MIVIWGKEDCFYCSKAKSLCEEMSLEYAYFDISDLDLRVVFDLKYPDAKTVPQIEWDQEYVGGYNELARKVAML